MQVRPKAKEEVIESAAGDIHVPVKNSSHIPLDMNFEFVPQNPYTVSNHDEGLGKSTVLEGNIDKPGFFETAAAESRAFNFSYQGISGADRFLRDSSAEPDEHTLIGKIAKSNRLLDIPPPGWNPKSSPEMFLNIAPEYNAYLMQATGPKDLMRRADKVRQEQRDREVLANGAISARILGGLFGVVTDPTNYIPIIGWAKYGKFSPTILKSATNAFPGMAVTSVLQNAANQADQVNGNLPDFLTNSLVETVMGTTLFAGLGAAGLSADKMGLWGIRKYAVEHLSGIDFKLNLNDQGMVDGYKAIVTGEAKSAAKVDFAQDMANSAFDKSGLFKIPYLGDATLKFMSMPILGTPLPRLLTSKFKALSAFVDRAIDHNFITKGMREGQAAPDKFETMMKQTFSEMRALQVQMNALHLERNGFDVKSRMVNGLRNVGLGLRNKTLEVLGKDLDNAGYISMESFYGEVEQVLISETSSEHAAVNEAANMLRPVLDDTYSAFRKAYNLPEIWMPPKTAAGYLMRVYDTAFLNSNEHEWMNVVTKWLRDSDTQIEQRMMPINEMKDKIAAYKEYHGNLIRGEGVTDEAVSSSVKEMEAMNHKLRSMEETLQDELRNNPDFLIHVDDVKALSATEAKELKAVTKPLDAIQEKIDKQQKIVTEFKDIKTKSKSASLKRKTVKGAQTNAIVEDVAAQRIADEEAKLQQLKDDWAAEDDRLQMAMHNNEINPAFYEKVPDSNRYRLKDPKNRLKFRDIHESELHRQNVAKGAYDTILNQTAEETINQVMGKATGTLMENAIKQRTLLIPDKILYDNKFMTKDLMSKVSNYVSYLSRRTHLKTVFNDVTLEGGIEPMAKELVNNYESFRAPLNEKKAELKKKLSTTISPKAKEVLNKQIKSVEKEMSKLRREFEQSKFDMNHLYEKMMGIRKSSRKAQIAQKAIMSLTSMASLPFVPFTMINDISANGLQHGLWPFIRDGVYPILQSLGGVLKTKDSEALRKTAPNVHLALQDVLNGHADKNWSMYTDPYLNLGKITTNLDKIAHSASNFTLTTYFDNGLQHLAGAISQGEFMRILHAYKAGTMTKSEEMYLLKYGIKPSEWADRMIAAFEKDGGGKTAVGGYQSNFWRWGDLEASSKFSNSVYRAVQSTTIQRGLADSPFWADNVIGSIVHGFSGWTYASVNRYVIPSLQAPDAQKLVGVMFMLATGSLVSPLRRMARGEDMFPESMTDKQRLWETIQDSGYFSWFANVLSDADLIAGGKLLGKLKNDRYKDRTRVGLLGPGFGKANQLADVVTALASGEWNENDAKKAARMIPFVNSSWTWWMSQSLIESIGLPKTRADARTKKQF